MTRLYVKTLTEHAESQCATLILASAPSGSALGIVIPMNEANRLARVLGLTACRHAPIYELVTALAGHFGIRIRRAVLHGEVEGICATLALEQDGLELELPCHPADAVALAIRADAPVYATAAAMSHACPDPDVESDNARVAAWLDGLRPDHFGRTQTGASESPS